MPKTTAIVDIKLQHILSFTALNYLRALVYDHHPSDPTICIIKSKLFSRVQQWEMQKEREREREREREVLKTVKTFFKNKLLLGNVSELLLLFNSVSLNKYAIQILACTILILCLSFWFVLRCNAGNQKDFRQAYGSVWRHALLYKLSIMVNINGKFFNIIYYKYGNKNVHISLPTMLVFAREMQ